MARRDVRSVRRHRVPAWWSDAKLGIFVHWTPASVPAYAPVDAEIGELLARRDPRALAWSPYAEWYQNSMRFEESPVARFHALEYPGRTYDTFVAEWEAALVSWDPSGWARRFAAAGARYVVLVAKHHDGYCLWPTGVANPHKPRFHSTRDVVGELAEAVRGEGLRFGLYYSGGLDWTFDDTPIGAFSDLIAAQPRGGYPAYAEAQVRELIARYRPSVLWNDISWPGTVQELAGLLGHYYRAVPDGVVNDRFMPWSPLWELARSRPARGLIDRQAARNARSDRGIVPPKPPLFDVRTPEYTVFDTVQTSPWECVRGIDRSFGHNRLSDESDFLTRRDLLWSLADIVAKGGNLLLNVGPRGEDATIADAQLRRLDWLAEFTGDAGAALFGSRPWVRPEGRAPEVGVEVRYTARDDTVFALVRRGRDPGGGPITAVTLTELATTPASEVTSAGGGRLATRDTPSGLRVTLGAPLDDERPTVVALRHVEALPPGGP